MVVSKKIKKDLSDFFSNSVSVNWVTLASKSRAGSIQLANLFYERKMRPDTVGQIVKQFGDYLGSEYDSKNKYRLTQSNAMNCLPDFVFQQTKAGNHVRIKCPKISGINGAVADEKVICRIAKRGKAIRHYALHSAESAMVRPKYSRPGKSRGRIIKRFEQDLQFTASANLRKKLRDVLTSTSVKPGLCYFFTFQRSLQPYRSKASGSARSGAEWACYQVGILEHSDLEPLIQILFELDDETRKHMLRPSIFSSEGYVAFCADDDDETGCGLTQQLDNKERTGLPEFILPSSQQPRVTGALNLGLIDKDMDEELVAVDTIVNFLHKRVSG